jgi:hypothetical protein
MFFRVKSYSFPNWQMGLHQAFQLADQRLQFLQFGRLLGSDFGGPGFAVGASKGMGQ